MKRHVSIFTFLLGAFAATAQAGNLAVSGGYYYIENSYKGRSATYMSVEGGGMGKTGLNEGDELTFYAHPGKGLLMKEWGVCWGNSGGANIWHYTALQEKIASNKTNYTWKVAADRDPGYLAVNFKYILFDITFDGNDADGGAQSMNPLKDWNIDTPEIALPSCTFTRTGYGMVGWSNAVYWTAHKAIIRDGGSVKGEDFWDDTAKKFDGTLVAQWKPNRHSVTCDLGNGTWPTAEYEPPTEVTYDQVFSLPAPTRTGYGFIGWKVTEGLDSSTAKWGKDGDPSSQIEKDTLCINGDKEVCFKNLNPTNGAAVTLTAQWQAKSFTVTFNNTGGSSGGGLLDALDVTYDAAYPALNVPSKGGNLFRGYEIDEVQYWDMTGQPTKVIWDIPSNCTAVAQWEKLAYQLTYNENRSNGTVSKTVVRDFEYGVPTVLYDGADFSNLGCTLLGWSTDPNALAPSYEPGGSATFTESKALYAVWEKNYFIAYDGNGATNETPMAIQKFVFGKANQSLNPNTYGKVGYSFLGWATNRVAAQQLDLTYEDRQILKDDLATTLGETNTLYATWGTNTYFIAFNPNGGTGTMSNQPFVYDQSQRLRECTFKRGELWSFAGWTNSVAGGSFYTNREEVVNLCAEDKGVVTLDAVWVSDVGELSEAMGCDNLKWVSDKVWEGGENLDAWEVCTTNGLGGSCAQLVHKGSTADLSTMHANIGTNGTLTFKWQPVSESDRLSVVVVGEKNPEYYCDVIFKAETIGGWSEAKVLVSEFVDGETGVQIKISLAIGSTCFVDQMTWTPKGAHPEPTDANKVTISSAMVSDGKFVLSFPSDAQFDYNLLTNANLLINSWGVMGEKKTGDGKILTFKPEIIENQPQMFYRVDTIQRK